MKNCKSQKITAFLAGLFSLAILVNLASANLTNTRKTNDIEFNSNLGSNLKYACNVAETLPNLHELGATDYVKGELIVKFKQGVVVGENVWESIARTPSLYNLHVKWGIENYEKAFRDVENDPNLSRIFVLKLPENTDIVIAARDYEGDSHVEYAQPNYTNNEVALVPNDPFYNSSGTWGQSYGDMWSLKIIQAEKAWDEFKTEGDIGAGVIVAVVDT
ncbi:MAG: hypothetical protein AB1706_19630, partial [Pseudomonadota bacterium]